MTFIFSWLGNKLHSDTPLIVAIITEGCRIWEKSTVSHPQDFVDFHFAATQILTEIFFLVHMSQHNGNYRMIAFYWYVLCIGILLSWHANDVMFLGCQANFGTQKNYATGTLAHANEIIHDIHLANTLFQKRFTRIKYGCRLQWFITFHVSFNVKQHIVAIYEIWLVIYIAETPPLRVSNMADFDDSRARGDDSTVTLTM